MDIYNILLFLNTVEPMIEQWQEIVQRINEWNLEN